MKGTPKRTYWGAKKPTHHCFLVCWPRQWVENCMSIEWPEITV